MWLLRQNLPTDIDYSYHISTIIEANAESTGAN